MKSSSRQLENTATPNAPVQGGVAEDRRAGALIINADDWGRDRETTDRTLDCIRARSVSAVSAMVFMADSERAAAIAQDAQIDAGLHLNFTTKFSAPNVGARLVEHHAKLARYLSKHAFARALYNPVIASSFEYVVTAQIEEFRKLYGREPDRMDGHHHMHLSANVLLGGLLPRGIIVRRHFSFENGEKYRNRLFRLATDMILTKRYRLVDLFFSLPPLENGDRLARIFALSRERVIEVMTHPTRVDEYRFLTSDGLSRNHAADAPSCFTDLRYAG